MHAWSEWRITLAGSQCGFYILPMPELPEVETIRRQLSQEVPLRIESVEYSPHAHSIVKEECFYPEGKSIICIKRHGKALDFHWEGDCHLVSHLGMSGSWRLSGEKVVEKHTHVQWKGVAPDGKRIYFAYVDPRRFGRMLYLDRAGHEEYMARWGPDVSSDQFQGDYIRSVFKRYPERKLKEFLLDQKYFAGIGNYIACEVCAHARLRPTRRVKTLSRMDCQRIRDAVELVIGGQIEHKGLTFQGGYTDAMGDKGEGLSRLVVFHQKICGLCKITPVKKIVLAQRGTFYCPRCQR